MCLLIWGWIFTGLAQSAHTDLHMHICTYVVWGLFVKPVMCTISCIACMCLLDAIFAGVYSGQRNAILPRSDNTQSLTVIPGEHVYSIPIPLVNLEFNCSVAAEDREGLRNSEWSSAVRVEPLITSPPSKWAWSYRITPLLCMYYINNTHVA